MMECSPFARLSHLSRQGIKIHYCIVAEELPEESNNTNGRYCPKCDKRQRCIFNGQLNLTVSNWSRHLKNEEGVHELYVVPSLAGFTFVLNILPFYLDFA